MQMMVVADPLVSQAIKQHDWNPHLASEGPQLVPTTGA